MWRIRCFRSRLRFSRAIFCNLHQTWVPSASDLTSMQWPWEMPWGSLHRLPAPTTPEAKTFTVRVWNFSRDFSVVLRPAHAMLPLMYLKTALIYNCPLFCTEYFPETVSTLEHGIWGSLILCSQAIVTYSYPQNKMGLYSFRGRNCVLPLQIQSNPSPHILPKEPLKSRCEKGK